jgi:SAM-dependent methyltransferase
MSNHFFSKRSCTLCGSQLMGTGQVCGDSPSLAVVRCDGCELLQLASFDHINFDRYSDDSYFPEHLDDIFEREAHWNVNRINRLKIELPDHRFRRVLDFGCGIGGFLQRAAAEFECVVGFDLSRRMVKVNQAAGSHCVNRLEDVPDDICTIVLFHVLEHVPEPWALLTHLLQRFPSVNRVVIEVPNGAEFLTQSFTLPNYAKIHYSSDHLYYFTNRTLAAIVEKAGLKVLLNSQSQRYTLGNTLGWLAERKGGGQERRTFFNEPSFHSAYESALTKVGLADSLFLIAQRS